VKKVCTFLSHHLHSWARSHQVPYCILGALMWPNLLLVLRLTSLRVLFIVVTVNIMFLARCVFRWAGPRPSRATRRDARGHNTHGRSAQSRRKGTVVRPVCITAEVCMRICYAWPCPRPQRKLSRAFDTFGLGHRIRLLWKIHLVIGLVTEHQLITTR
jgi:hypothetical protein